jgi:single-strand DNA-binding protein
MIITTVAGNVGKDAELRDAGGASVLGFSVAGTAGWGDREQTLWFNCSIWGKRGESLAQYIKKGTRVTVSGELSQREYEGKQYLELRVEHIKLQDTKANEQQAPAAPAAQRAPSAPPAADSYDVDIPF